MNKSPVPKKSRLWPGTLIPILCIASCLVLSCKEELAKTAATPTAGPTSPPKSEKVSKEFLRASDVMLPASLGMVQERFDGTLNQPLILLVGESHVNLTVQQHVADILSYLRSTYNITLICAEGFSGSLPLPNADDALLARRTAAESELRARHINGLSYVALAYPDVRVIGVENMEIYQKHKAVLSGRTPEVEAWFNDLRTFVTEKVPELPKAQGESVLKGSAAYSSDHDLDRLLNVIKRSSAVDPPIQREFGALLKRKGEVWKAAEQQASDQLKVDAPLMKARNEAMVNATVALSGENTSLALLVGRMHLPGIQGMLRAAGRPFVSILVNGVSGKSVDAPISDAKLYQDWDDGKPTELEKWLGLIPPKITLSRETLRNKISVLGALVNASRMLSQGSPEADARLTLQRANLTQKIEIVQTFPIRGGYGIKFTAGDKTGYFYSSSQKLPELVNHHPNKIESGEAGEQVWAVFDGGAGKKPPIPPPPPGIPPSPPGGEFGKRLAGAINDQNRGKGTAVTVAFISERGMIYRRVGTSWLALGISTAESRKLIQQFKESKPGPERLLTAQRISKALLTGIDEEIPHDRKVLYQVFQDDLLGDLSLPTVAALANESSAKAFSNMKGIYTLTWRDVQNNLGALNWSPKPADIKNTVVWISSRLGKSDQDRRSISALEGLGVRLNEPLQPGDTLILLGAGKNEVFELRNGTRISPRSAAFKSKTHDAEAIVAFNVDDSRLVSIRTEQLKEQKVPVEEILSEGRELVDRIRERSGKEPLEEILREGAAEKRAEALRKETLRSNLEHLAPALQAKLNIDSKAMKVQQVT